MIIPCQDKRCILPKEGKVIKFRVFHSVYTSGYAGEYYYLTIVIYFTFKNDSKFVNIRMDQEIEKLA